MSVDPSSSLSPARSIFESLEGRQFLSASLLTTESGPNAQTEPAIITTLATKTTTRTSIKQLTTTSVAGQAVRLTAYVSRRSGAPVGGGVVTFKNGTTVLGTATVVDGQARLFVTALPVGASHPTVVFNGTKSLATSTAVALTHTVNKANSTAAVTLSTASALMGVPVTLTASVAASAPGAGVPRGSMQFYDGATLLGTSLINKRGRAALVAPTWYPTTHSVTAKYLGNASYNVSTSSAKTLTIAEGSFTTLANNLKVSTRVAGSGAGAVNGQNLVVDYTGYLTNGTKFESSLDSGNPFPFTLGNSEVIQGWEKGLVGIKVGETRLLKIPPALAYGAAGQGNIPGNATLYFIVKLREFGVPKLVVQGGTNHAVSIANNQTPSTTIGTAFGSSPVNTSTTAHVFALANGGAGVLSFTATPSITLSGANAADFVLTQPTFPGDGTAQFTVAFKPKATGARSAVVTVFTNDPNFPQFKFTVTGTGA